MGKQTCTASVAALLLAAAYAYASYKIGSSRRDAALRRAATARRTWRAGKAATILLGIILIVWIAILIDLNMNHRW